MMTMWEKTVDELIADGWTFDRRVTFRGYYYSGYVSNMKSRDGYDYCRVHTGSSISRGRYQITLVYRRPATD